MFVLVLPYGENKQPNRRVVNNLKEKCWIFSQYSVREGLYCGVSMGPAKFLLHPLML